MAAPSLSHCSSEDFLNVYEPAEDSFAFMDALERDFDSIYSQKPALVLEVGCGSGILSTHLVQSFLAKNRNCQPAVIVESGTVPFILAIDINQTACDLTHRTVLANGVHEYVDVVAMDMFSALRKNGCSFDMVVFNPPYVPGFVNETSAPGIDAAWAGGSHGNEVIQRFMLSVTDILAPNAVVYLLMEERNCPENILQDAKRSGFSPHEVLRRRAYNELLTIWRFSKR